MLVHQPDANSAFSLVPGRRGRHEGGRGGLCAAAACSLARIVRTNITNITFYVINMMSFGLFRFMLPELTAGPGQQEDLLMLMSTLLHSFSSLGISRAPSCWFNRWCPALEMKTQPSTLARNCRYNVRVRVSTVNSASYG